MEHTGNIMQDDTHIISSLLKMFLVFEILFSYRKKDLDTLSLEFINFKIKTGLDPETNFTWVYDKSSPNFCYMQCCIILACHG